MFQILPSSSFWRRL